MKRSGRPPLLRVFCAVIWTFVLAMPASAQQVRACGVERWQVKIGSDADVALVDTVPARATVAQLVALPRPAELWHARRADAERRTYAVTALVLSAFREDDSDWHLVLADTGDVRITMIAELPAADCALGSRYMERFAAVAPVLDTLRPPALVEVTGIAFFDLPHGQRGLAPNAIELHPITALRVTSRDAATVRRLAPGAPVTMLGGGKDTVWVNTRSHVYHCPGSRWYGRTARGAFMTERDARGSGARPARGRACG